MDKLKLQSFDVIGSNIQKIQQLFPNCVTERLSKDGKPELAIDFEKLQAELSNDIIAEGEERYQFTWPDKRVANRLANIPTTMTLRPCREESVDFDHTQNLYIEGDNLDVLKVLRETYLGKVKIIYIDPPYNTGNDFVYNDNFAQSRDKFEETNGLFDEEGNQIIDPMQRNTESNGRFHTDWLNMIYPRLKVARDLLEEDGAIFISIDENEHSNLLSVMNEIFGEANYVDSIVWDKKASAKGVPPQSMMVNVHEYIVVYCKSLEFKFIGEKRDAEKDGFKNPDNDPRGPWRESNIKSTIKPIEDAFTIIDPNTGKQYTNTWAFSKESLEKMISEGRILWKESLPKQKEFMYEMTNENKAIKSSWGVFDAQSTTVYLKHLIPEVKFDNPKPINLMSYLVEVTLGKDSTILDFFSGSATTAHAIMKLNAEDGGNRKFIMVQLPELTDEKSEAYKAGYKNICEIGKERIRRAGKKIKEENKDKVGIEKLDTGFRVLKLDTSNMEDVYYTPQEFTPQSLFNENVKSDRTSEDLLFQVMLDLGIELSVKIETRQMAGKMVHFVDDNYLVACFDREVNETTITEIAKLKPVYFVMRDASAANDNVIDNFEQIFHHYSPDTNCRII
ncbi:site-specific DNA-methyltransferase [Alistipes shahii]|jgi:type III restriction-modification system methyltransferase (adenine-specific)/adenine specific DNA methylase mod|uniref:site-specific DNA-methyltransferase n=2 Tax=Alistipes shahii TaxID=328814 RepID=UPI000E90AC50|nr:site-specific DNA-methyltransferase [Bacteroides uniformis]